jgi:hypothetical protein
VCGNEERLGKDAEEKNVCAANRCYPHGNLLILTHKDFKSGDARFLEAGW